ncbi:MAG: deoxyribodipyrimidine photo-lyase [Chthoniobacterales bacterium]
MHIHWFRRDLRLTDNTALHAATQSGMEVVPVYILSNWRKNHPWTGLARQQFLCGCLESLAKNLATIGGRLIVRQGGAVAELRKLIRETRATSIFTNRDPDPFGRVTEVAVAKMAAEEGCKLVLCQDIAIHERDEVRTGTGGVFRVFTPYAKAWRKLPKPGSLPKLSTIRTPENISSLPLPTLETRGLAGRVNIVEAGEDSARTRLKNFLGRKIFQYDATRNLPEIDGGSRLSQDLRWGLISPREVYWRSAEAAARGNAVERKSAEVFINELIWREFYLQILWHFPEVLESDFNPKYAQVEWKSDDAAFARWCAGETGFPIVDAAMRQLNATGFMHNRLRMITAMFLTKDLHIHWREGERYFMQKLVDGEIASNNGGWQWSAGTGADAAPYFRIQNPWLQTARFDGEGKFIQRWLPELAQVEPRKFCEPPGLPLARNYPLPMVDHHRERDVTLELFRRGLDF